MYVCMYVLSTYNERYRMYISTFEPWLCAIVYVCTHVCKWMNLCMNMNVQYINNTWIYDFIRALDMYVCVYGCQM